MKTALVAFLCLLVLPASAWSWSAKGHGDIAVAALEDLPVQVREQYVDILRAGPWAKGKTRWQAIVSSAAAWPDRIRDEPLQRLFARYGSGKVPAALAAYHQKNTGDWHYTNALYLTPQGKIVAASTGENVSCPPRAQGRLLQVWPDIVKAYGQVTDVKDKSLLLVFLLHLLADGYQPLHLMASLDENCKHDRGGNAFCLAPTRGFHPGQRCEQSLHFLWDQGFGVFDGDLDPGARFRGNARSLDGVVAQARSVAGDVYPSKPEQALRDQYTKRGRTQVGQLSGGAAAHLKALLLQLARP
jgi:hypothetical protein